jgi:hypothetical protein
MLRRSFPRPAATIACLLLAIAAAACDDEPAGPRFAGTRVLFIGNSLTYFNDLPGTLRDVALAAGDTLSVGSVAVANTALIDHAYGQTDALAAVRGRQWDHVVLQQGPTSLRLCRDTLVLSAQLFDAPVRASGAVPALMMTWPPFNRLAYFDAVRDSYRAATRAVNGDFYPVGEAWREAWRRDASLPLYTGDGYHPAPLGTLLAALVIYEHVTGRDARDLPGRLAVAGRTLDVPEATIRLLQDVAHDVNVLYAPPAGLGDPADDVIVDSPPPNQVC